MLHYVFFWLYSVQHLHKIRKGAYTYIQRIIINTLGNLLLYCIVSRNCFICYVYNRWGCVVTSPGTTTSQERSFTIRPYIKQFYANIYALFHSEIITKFSPSVLSSKKILDSSKPLFIESHTVKEIFYLSRKCPYRAIKKQMQFSHLYTRY